MQRRIDLGNELSLAVARSQFKRSVRLGRSAIFEIWQHIFLILEMLERFFALAQDIVLPGQELMPEILSLPLVHE